MLHFALIISWISWQSCSEKIRLHCAAAAHHLSLSAESLRHEEQAIPAATWLTQSFISLGYKWLSPDDLMFAKVLTLPFGTFVLCCCHAGSGETPTLDTVDSYMKKLHSLIISNPQEHESLINTVRDVVSRLDRWEFSLSYRLFLQDWFILSDKCLLLLFPLDNCSSTMMERSFSVDAAPWLLLVCNPSWLKKKKIFLLLRVIQVKVM